AGEVIGIVSHIISKSGGNEGLGFVVTMKTARQILIEHKSVWGGLESTLLTGALAEIFNVPGGAGYLVKTVAKDSPAWHAGVLGGDRVATIDGQDHRAPGRQGDRADRQDSVTDVLQASAGAVELLADIRLSILRRIALPEPASRCPSDVSAESSS